MKKWVIFNTHTGKQMGDSLGYESRDLAERCAQSYSTMEGNWFADIGVFEMVSSAKFAPKGELTRLDGKPQP